MKGNVILNNRIKYLRKVLNLTQQEFGKRIGIKRNSVALIEGGRNTSDWCPIHILTINRMVIYLPC